MRGGTPWLCIAILASVVGCTRGAEICERGKTWWDRDHNVCAPCTRCDPAHLQAVRFPCEIHRNTVCQSLKNVRIFPFNTPKNISALSDDEYYEYDVDYESEVTDSDEGGISWDLQTSSLTLAASGCVVFFLVVLILSLYHAKEWRILKRALKSGNTFAVIILFILSTARIRLLFF